MEAQFHGIFDFYSIAILPRHFRRNEEIHIQAVLIVVVNIAAEPRKRLDAGTSAAPEGVERSSECLVPSRTERFVVHQHAGCRMLRWPNAVDEGTFVVVGVGRIGIPREQVRCEFEHVI